MIELTNKNLHLKKRLPKRKAGVLPIILEFSNGVSRSEMSVSDTKMLPSIDTKPAAGSYALIDRPLVSQEMSALRVEQCWACLGYKQDTNIARQHFPSQTVDEPYHAHRLKQEQGQE